MKSITKRYGFLVCGNTASTLISSISNSPNFKNIKIQIYYKRSSGLFDEIQRTNYMFFYVDNEDEKEIIEKLWSECKSKYINHKTIQKTRNEKDCNYLSEQDIEDILNINDMVDM